MPDVTHIILQCPQCKDCMRVPVDGLWGPIHDDRLCDHYDKVFKRKIVGYTLVLPDGTAVDVA